MKVIIPMAGNGSRFSKAGYQHPKPFIDVNGKPMIKRVVESLLQFQFEHIFLMKAEHYSTYNMNAIFPHLKFRTVPIFETTQGAAITVSEYATGVVPYDEDILIVNSDQLFEFNNHSIDEIRNSDVDGCIWCFEGNGPNWSYLKTDENGYVTKVAEKKQISNIATGGMYYWRSFRTFADSVGRMVQANDRTNNEFYVAPTYNYMPAGSKTVIRMLDHVDQLGTPEELQAYENKIRIY